MHNIWCISSTIIKRNNDGTTSSNGALCENFCEQHRHQSGEKESAPNVYARNRLTKIIIKSLTI